MSSDLWRPRAKRDPLLAGWTPFAFVCNWCTGDRFTRTTVDRWDVGEVLATADGLPTFVAHRGTGGPLAHRPIEFGVSCDNPDCEAYNEDVQYLAGLVEPGPLCWLPGMPVLLDDIADVVVAIDPNPDAPRVLLASGRAAPPEDLYYGRVNPPPPGTWTG